MSGRDIAVVIVNDSISCCGNRDYLLLSNHFIHNGYEVRSFWNITGQQMLKELNVFAREIGEVRSVVIVLVSHSNFIVKSKLDLVDGFDAPLNIKKITRALNSENCPVLQGVPKIFIVSTCRGKQSDETYKSVNCSGFLPLGDRILDYNNCIFYAVAPKGESCCTDSSLLVKLFCEQYHQHRSFFYNTLFTTITRQWTQDGPSSYIPIVSSTLTDLVCV